MLISTKSYKFTICYYDDEYQEAVMILVMLFRKPAYRRNIVIHHIS